MLLDYRRKRVIETFGDTRLVIECLEDLDRTIDDVFAWLEKTGNPALLEELCPYFGVVWPAARILTSSLARESAGLKGARLIELGCGLAIPGMLAALHGAEVTAADNHPEVPIFLKQNLEHNGIVERFRFEPLDWQKPDAAARLGERGYDWVIGSDILYERSHPANVARAIDRLAAPGGVIRIADPARPYLQLFVDEMSRLGYSHRSRVENEIFLFDFSRAQP